MDTQRLGELLSAESAQLDKLKEIVNKSIDEERLLSDKLCELEDSHPNFQSRMADKVASFGGSWYFILSFMAFMLIWISINVFLLTRPFDAYPFILLNLILSTVAAIQAPIIMMSQNRKEEKDRQRAISDYLINLKAEIEVRNLHNKMDLLMSEQMQTLFEIQKTQLELMQEISEKLQK